MLDVIFEIWLQIFINSNTVSWSFNCFSSIWCIELIAFECVWDGREWKKESYGKNDRTILLMCVLFDRTCFLQPFSITTLSHTDEMRWRKKIQQNQIYWDSRKYYEWINEANDVLTKRIKWFKTISVVHFRKWCNSFVLIHFFSLSLFVVALKMLTSLPWKKKNLEQTVWLGIEYANITTLSSAAIQTIYFHFYLIVWMQDKKNGTIGQ